MKVYFLICTYRLIDKYFNIAFPQHQPNNNKCVLRHRNVFLWSCWLLIYRIYSFLFVFIYFVKWKGNLFSNERQGTLTAPMFTHATTTDSNNYFYDKNNTTMIIIFLVQEYNRNRI